MEVSQWPKDLCACGKKVDVCGGMDTFCWCHNAHEESDDKTYLVCYECNHVYQTSVELEMAYTEACGRRVPANEIFFCQFCIHDF